jgi:hypothetical protein
VTLLVGFLVEAEGLLAVRLVGNDGFGAALVEPLSQFCAIIHKLCRRAAFWLLWCAGSNAALADNRVPGRRSAGRQEDGP